MRLVIVVRCFMQMGSPLKLLWMVPISFEVVMVIFQISLNLEHLR